MVPADGNLTLEAVPLDAAPLSRRLKRAVWTATTFWKSGDPAGECGKRDVGGSRADGIGRSSKCNGPREGLAPTALTGVEKSLDPSAADAVRLGR